MQGSEHHTLMHVAICHSTFNDKKSPFVPEHVYKARKSHICESTQQVLGLVEASSVPTSPC